MKKVTLLLSLFCIFFSIPSNAQPFAFDTLDINNVRAVFNSVGINFSDQYNSFFEVPKGSNHKTISCNTLWLGGMDVNGQWKLSGGITSSGGKDYYPGPLTADGTASTDSATMSQWNKVWKVTKQEILFHQSHYGTTGYIIPEGIATWPAHGDVSANQAPFLAPFFDLNGDNVYNPSDGDYPLIRGDEAVFFIFNDKGGLHYATGAQPWGIEIQAMAFAFNCPSDSALNNSIFINYRIINRSTYRCTDVRLGVYSDINVGNSQNDYTGSDVKRGSFYSFSGTNTDPAFGNFFPAQAVTILNGPYMDPDGLDNPKYDTLIPLANCNEAINGQNFGDGDIDNERFGMTGFVSFIDTGSLSAITQPSNSGEYLGYLHNKWKDNSDIRYWGNGHISAGGTGPACNFMYTNNSDPCDWGTQPQSISHPPYWTESQASNTPGNRQGLGLSGSFTCEPQAEFYLDVAFIYGIDYTKPNNLYGWQSVLNQRIDSIRKYYINDSTPCGGSISGIEHTPTHAVEMAVIVYPNPATATINISGIADFAKAEVFDISGKLLLSKRLTSQKLDISSLATGMYFIKLTTAEGTLVRKFVKE